MRIGRPRVLLWALLIAVAIALAIAWYAGSRTSSTPESRARDTADGIRERVHDATH